MRAPALELASLVDIKNLGITVHAGRHDDVGGGTVNPIGLAIDKNGDVWFSQFRTSRIGQLNPDTGQIKEYSTGTLTAGTYQIIADSDAKDIERVTLYVNKTQFVSDNGDYNIIASDGDFSDLNNINISVDLPETTVNREQLYARIGVRMVGVEDMIFSPVEKIDL